MTFTRDFVGMEACLTGYMCLKRNLMKKNGDKKLTEIVGGVGYSTDTADSAFPPVDRATFVSVRRKLSHGTEK